MIQLVLESLHHFCKNIFSGTLSRKQRFPGNSKQVFRIHFPEFSLPTYLPLTINYSLTPITSNIDF